ncbi:hypothetical protein [Pseudobacteriovorax antillogorgiicola]|uniref:Auto-transporter adhesin head GIN domain-containing protein n=1 Tax=Pseudobacteriovorax antillogorgiicola TaxID=1513793 RepID=A0A1Y6BF24_9BACT|nr:hypothetical protein [Pseudobacteriovorax antillogorgiicola]TCS57505.1 hypothetical protein EDD56_103245 [Pseudobacteriovorax antillogorgiicola]SMF00302.1 hypothetical protein SAMN06296036_10388 [Pseudobacteriovorax antillogorgiicola]
MKFIVVLLMSFLSLLACESEEFAGETALRSGTEVNVVSADQRPEPGNEEKGSEKGDEKGDTNSNVKCSKLEDGSYTELKINGNQESVSIEDNKAIVARITGNQSQFDLELVSEEPVSVAALCLFIAGNQQAVTIRSNLNISLVEIRARGNQGKIEIEMADGYAIEDLQTDVKGNGSTVWLNSMLISD